MTGDKPTTTEKGRSPISHAFPACSPLDGGDMIVPRPAALEDALSDLARIHAGTYLAKRDKPAAIGTLLCTEDTAIPADRRHQRDGDASCAVSSSSDPVPSRAGA